jgi:hypothetical protein
MLAGEGVSGRVAPVLVEALNGDETNSLPPAGPARARDQSVDERHQARVATEQGKDVTEWYRERYRGVVAAERLGGEVLVLFDEGEFYGVTRRTLAFPGTDREVLVRCWVDHVPKSRIDPTRPLFGQWPG